MYNKLNKSIINSREKIDDLNNNKISGIESADALMESYLEKYSNLLLEKFEEKLNKK